MKDQIKWVLNTMPKSDDRHSGYRYSFPSQRRF